MNTEKTIIELTKNISIAALIVGTSIVGMKHVNNYIVKSAIKEIDNYEVKMFKTISFHSKEIDAINELK